jgi:predicted molibdopterin-dependent oxidoreductase YjgC
VIIGRGNLTEAAETLAAAAKTINDVHPDVKFLSALRRANVHGALDMGMAPGLLAGRATLDGGADAVAGLWPRVPTARGLDAAGILAAAAAGKIDTLFLLGADPLSDFPDRDLAERGLAGARTVIATDLFLTESVRQADVVLPAAGFAEVRGTTTNLEGRISTVSQKVTPPGTAQSDWVIAADIARRLGYDLGIESPAHVWDELRQVAPLFARLGDVLADAGDEQGVVVEWPRRRDELDDMDLSGSSEASELGDTLGVKEAATPGDAVAPPASDPGHVVGANGSAPVEPAPLPDWTVVEPPLVDAYGLRLVATRKLYDRGTQLRHSSSLVGLSEGAVVRLNPHDFQRLGVAPGDEARVASARTHVLVPVRPSEAVPRGVALLHVNQSGGRVNALIDSKTVVTDVRVERP